MTITTPNYGIMDSTKYECPRAALTAEGVTLKELSSMPSKSTPSPSKFSRSTAGQVEVSCTHCGRAMFVDPNRTRRYKRFYCDRKCQDSDVRSLEDRFFEKVEKSPDGCWRWTGYIDITGYGRIRDQRGKSNDSVHVHRVSYEMHKGEIPKGQMIDHICRNRWCVNPDHLRACSNGSNVTNGTRRKNNTSGYIGVTLDRRTNTWVTQIVADGKNHRISRFLCPIEAAIARDVMAIELHDEHAVLNFPKLRQVFGEVPS